MTEPVISLTDMDSVTTPLTSAEPRPASTLIHAHQWSTQSGSVQVDTQAPDWDSIGGMAAGDWVCYNSLDFGSGELTLFMAYAAAAAPGRTIEARIDSPDGALLGTLVVAATGAEDIFQEHYAPISATGGIHDLY